MELKNNAVFPFCAVMGQDTVKKALILNVINPSIGGVLISGEKGTAKSTLVRGLAAILKDTDVVELPLNVTEDRLVGAIDIEKTIRKGQKCFEPGILKKAHGNILYVDEVNLLSEYIVNCLLEVSASHVNHVEREGISCSHESSFIPVGTMNPEEGALRPQFLDCFGLYVEVGGSRQLSERKEIIKRRLEYEKAPMEYMERWKAESGELSGRIDRARRALGNVKVSEDILKLASEISMEGNCAGHRAELAVIETAKAMAAFENRKHITASDVRKASELALPHRVREMPPKLIDNSQREEDKQESSEENDRPESEDQDRRDQAVKNEEEKEDGLRTGENNGQEDKSGDRASGREEKDTEEAGSSAEGSMDQPDMPDMCEEENIEEPGEAFEIRPLNIEAMDRKKRRGSGKRSRTNTSSSQGRYIRYTFPKGKLKDLAFDATLRAAAPYQKTRKVNGMAISIRSSDFREKIREKRTGSTILFIVDASGSMGVRQRMKAVKGAILSILNDAYQKRDKVGMIAFRKDDAQLLLGITRSVELAQKRLKELPTGGKTPLASGLHSGYELLKAARLRDPEMIPLLVLVSDGRTNVPLNGRNPVDAAMGIAGLIAAEGIRCLVIDTEKDFIKLGLASKIAKAMNADYYKLEELEQGEIEYAVRSFVHNDRNLPFS